MLPSNVSFGDALHVAGKMGKLNVIETKIDVTDGEWWKDKYNIWSGLIGGFFLALSYFGTDQSQVGRYLTAKSMKESRTSLLMNGLVKVPMQFLILLVGSMVFVFYMFYSSPIFFNQKEVDKVLKSEYRHEFQGLQAKYDSLNTIRSTDARLLSQAIDKDDQESIKQVQSNLQLVEIESKEVRAEALAVMKKADATADTNDTNYIFLYFSKILKILLAKIYSHLANIIFIFISSKNIISTGIYYNMFTSSYIKA